MKIFNSKYTLLFLLLVPLFMALIDLLVSRTVEDEVHGVLLQEKLLEATTAIDIIGTLAESRALHGIGDVKESIVGAVNYLDRVDQVYCAAYFEDADGKLTLISDRYDETGIFDPFEYDWLVNQINSCDSGNAVIGYTPKNQSFRELHVYFRWIAANSGRYLILAGVSKHTIQTQLDFWEARGGNGRIILIMTFWNMLIACVVLRVAFINGNGNGKKPTFKNIVSFFF